MGITAMFDFLRFVMTRRRESRPVSIDRRTRFFPYNYREANRVLADSVRRFEDAVTRATKK